MKHKRRKLDLRARMRLNRAALGINQREAGKRIGVSQFRYWRIEAGACEPNRDELRRIQTFLHETGAMGE